MDDAFIEKTLERSMLEYLNYSAVVNIINALRNEKLAKEFLNKFAEYGSFIYEDYLRKREELTRSLQNEPLKKRLEELLAGIHDQFACYGKEDIKPYSPLFTLECTNGAQLEKSILDAIYPHIKAGDYKRVKKVISYLSNEEIYIKIVKAFKNIFSHKSGYIPNILKETKNINETIKKIDGAYQYASEYIIKAIEDLFHKKEKDFLNKIEYGIQLNQINRENIKEKNNKYIF